MSHFHQIGNCVQGEIKSETNRNPTLRMVGRESVKHRPSYDLPRSSRGFGEYDIIHPDRSVCGHVASDGSAFTGFRSDKSN